MLTTMQPASRATHIIPLLGNTDVAGRKTNRTEFRPIEALSSVNMLRETTTSTGPDSSQSDPIDKSPNTSAPDPPPQHPKEPLIVQSKSAPREIREPQLPGKEFFADFEGDISQMTDLAPASEIFLPSSCCTPGEIPRKSIECDGQRNASCDIQAGSPSTITRSVCAKLKELEESGWILGSGIKENAFIAREWTFVQNNMKLLELAKGENPCYIYPTSFKKKRQAARVLMAELRGADVSSGIAKDCLRG